MARDKKEKKPLPKALRVVGIAANLALWNNSIIVDGPRAISGFLKKEKEIAAAEEAAK